MIAALILAAGPSTRLGRPKQLEPWGGTTLLGSILDDIGRAPVDEIWVVVGANMESVLEGVDLGEAGLIENPEWEEGIASSIRAGLDALHRLSKAEWAMLVLGDQPGIDPEVVIALVNKTRKTHSTVIVPKYRYARGTPMLIARSLWSRFISIEGDADPVELLKAHPDWVEEVWFENLTPRDVNTHTDVEELRPKR